MLKKLFPFMLILAVLVSFAAGCQKQETSSTTTQQTTTAGVPSEFVTVEYVFFGSFSDRMEAFVQNELKDKLKDELNMYLNVTYFPWGDYGPGNKIDMMIAAGEKIDCFVSDKGWMTQCIAKGLIKDITEPASKYLPDLRKVVAPEAFEMYTVDGKLYSVPIGNKPQGDYFYTTCVRQDLLEEVGMTDVKTMEDLTSFALKVKEKYPEMNATPDFELYQYARGISDKNITFFWELNKWIMIDQDNPETLIFSYTAPEFKTFCTYSRQWYENEMTPVELLTDQAGNTELFTSGKYCWWRGASLTSEVQDLAALQLNVPTGQMKEYSLNPDKPKYRLFFCNTNFCFPVTGENTERAIMYINWMQKSTEITDFLEFGVEGKDFNIVDSKVEKITEGNLFPGWMLLNVQIPTHFASSYPNEWIDRYLKWDDDAITVKEFNFAIDTEPITVEIAKIADVIAEYFVPIKYGFEKYEDKYEDAVAELNSAGLDKLMEEVQKQWTAYLSE